MGGDELEDDRGVLQLLLEQCRAGAQHRWATLIDLELAPGVGEHSALLGLAFADPHRAHQDQPFGAIQPMLRDGLQRLFLPRMGERAQGMGEADGDPASLQVFLAHLAEPFCQGQPAVDPVGLATSGRGDALRAQLVVFAQRLDHPHLVHRRRGSVLLVRLQQQDLALLGRPGPLQHDRDLGPSLTSPPVQALEPVQNFVGAVWIGCDP